MGRNDVKSTCKSFVMYFEPKPYKNLKIGEKCRGEKRLWGEMSLGRNVVGRNVFWGEMSYGEKRRGEKRRGEKRRGEKRLLGRNVIEPKKTDAYLNFYEIFHNFEEKCSHSFVTESNAPVQDKEY